MQYMYLTSLAILLPSALAQNVTVPTTCSGNFTAGTDEVLFTVPYTYSEVLSIIGNYSNLTWSGSPKDSVTLNGTDNTVGVARTYELAGLPIIETLLEYSQPPAPGPYIEVHNAALLSTPDVDVYIPFDGTVVTSVCEGTASLLNFTANFCATNVGAAAAMLHQLHLVDAQTVGVFLGGRNFTNCADLGASGSSGSTNVTGPVSNGTVESPAEYTGGAMRRSLGSLAVAVVAVWMFGVFC